MAVVDESAEGAGVGATVVEAVGPGVTITAVGPGVTMTADGAGVVTLPP